MPLSRPRRWLDGRFANVDGIPFRLPVGTKGSPALVAAYDIDLAGARDMLPGQELHPCRIGSRGVLVVAVVNYLDTVIGRYVEFCTGILCTRGRRSAPPLLPLALGRVFGTGAYIYDLPVSTEVSVKGGLGVWGMPKRQANLDFVVGRRTVSSQYDLDGELVLRIDVPRPPVALVPLRLSAVSYGEFRGMLTKSHVSLSGRAGVTLRGGSRARLLLGNSPRTAPLKRLDIAAEPLFTAYLPAMRGVLDDHVETWFLTTETAAGPPPEIGLRDVVDLGLSQEWLAPPDRERSDRMLLELRPPGAGAQSMTSNRTERRSR